MIRKLVAQTNGTFRTRNCSSTLISVENRALQLVGFIVDGVLPVQWTWSEESCRSTFQSPCENQTKLGCGGYSSRRGGRLLRTAQKASLGCSQRAARRGQDASGALQTNCRLERPAHGAATHNPGHPLLSCTSNKFLLECGCPGRRHLWSSWSVECTQPAAPRQGTIGYARVPRDGSCRLNCFV